MGRGRTHSLPVVFLPVLQRRSSWGRALRGWLSPYYRAGYGHGVWFGSAAHGIGIFGQIKRFIADKPGNVYARSIKSPATSLLRRLGIRRHF
jgi:hypothetical protein